MIKRKIIHSAASRLLGEMALCLRWSDAHIEVSQRITGYNEVMQANHDEISANAEWWAERITGRLSLPANDSNRVFSVDAVDHRNNLKATVLYIKPQHSPANIDMIWCNQQYRGNGITNVLIAYALADLHQRGAQDVETYNGELNETGKKFLLKSGWTETSLVIGGFEVTDANGIVVGMSAEFRRFQRNLPLRTPINA